jgi:hypothetical protein
MLFVGGHLGFLLNEGILDCLIMLVAASGTPLAATTTKVPTVTLRRRRIWGYFGLGASIRGMGFDITVWKILGALARHFTLWQISMRTLSFRWRHIGFCTPIRKV